MQCRNHVERPAVERCTGCAEPFCGECVVEMTGQKYCGSCKVMALKAPPVIVERTRPCPEASQALKYALIGIFVFGIVLEPVAISKALSARKLIAMDPTLTGEGKANAALIVAILVMLFWIVGILSKLKTP